MRKYRCPVCKKPLTKKEYNRALGELSDREKHLAHDNAVLKNKLREANINVKRAKEDGIHIGTARAQRLLAGKEKTIAVLKDRLEQLKKGTTPQTEGLEFEDKLVARLRREFPESDDIQPKGRDGDILHVVKFDKKDAGVIIYECKRTPKILSQHIRQAYLAKQARQADFAVLVTTGQKRNFTGLAEMSGILVVSPLAVIPLASLLRMHLIEMLRAKITKEQRIVIAQQLQKYITSPQFKNPIEEIVQLSGQLQEMIKDEAKEHFRVWKKRWYHYQRIQWDGSQIRKNVQLVLHGKKPEIIVHPKALPLQLPAPSE